MSQLNEQLRGSLALQQTATLEPQFAQPISTTPLHLLQIAVERGAQIDTIERLAKLQSDMLERDAEQAFNRSLHAAQSEMRRIGVDANNSQTRSKYATYAKIDGALRPVYTKHGFGLSFSTQPTESPDLLRVVCYVSHDAGHTRTYQIDMPSDGKGAKGGDVMTKTHATGAAASYGMRYLLKMIFNVAVGETDDDGNLGLPIGKEDEWIDHIRESSNLDELKSCYMQACKSAEAAKDNKALLQFAEAKNNRYRELQKGAKCS